MYTYKSPIGLMVIRYDKQIKKYILTINKTYNDYHDSKDSAASNVYMHETGCNEWDDLHGIVDPPHDISEWTYINSN